MTDFDRQLQLARQRGEQTVTSHPARARDVSFRSDTRTLAIAFANGCELLIPVQSIDVLQDASDELLAEVDLTPSLLGLRWDTLDVDLSIPGLMLDCFGIQTWTQEMGRRGGQVSSEAKRMAARANGKKGGRPKQLHSR
ncbi:MAG: DUF2442 domain-containing protein [Cyanobacteria bacterium J06639_1]